jgi:hypothetical protein
MSNRRFSALLLVLLCLGTGLALGQLTYNTSFTTEFTDGAFPAGLTVADFNRDGKPDIAALHATTLSILFNEGNGKFGAPHDTALPANSTSVQVLAADVNHDGKIDVVIAQSQPMQILVLLGNGNGTFQPPIIHPLVNTPDGIALGDFNNDGKIDLAVHECPASGDCDIAVYLGTGTGTFSPHTVLPAGSSASNSNLAVTDFNQDGKLDIAVAALGGASTSPTVSLFVFFGHGDGTFSSPEVISVPFTVPPNFVASAPTIAVGDFNGDAVDDIGVETGASCGGSACGESQMNIFLNNGFGKFSLKQQFATANNEFPFNWTAGDLNNDLTIDIARFSPSVRSGAFKTWTNNGHGIFTSVSNTFETTPAESAEIRDVNLDGLHDVVLTDFDFSTSQTQILVGLSQNGTPNCPPPPSNVLQAKMCTPGTTTSSTTFTVKASGNSPVGVKRVELWVDGHKVFQTLNDQLRKTLTLTKGTHQITVVAVDRYIGFAKTTRSVNVQ